MSIRRFSGERLCIVIVSVLFGALLSALAVCLWFNRMAVFSHYVQKSATPYYKELPPAKPIPLHVRSELKNQSNIMEQRTEQDDLGLMMFNPETGKRRILWTSGNLEKWLPGEQAMFVISLKESDSDKKGEESPTLICVDKLGREYPLFIQGEKQFRIDDWEEVLIRECHCATLFQKLTPE